MKKRLLSLALCIVLALSVMPSAAFAATPSGDPRAVYAETDDGSMRAAQVICYDGYYFINYPKACSIVRMKMDGSEIKQIVDTAGLGLLTNVESLYRNTTITDKSNISTWFIDIACYNGKLYLQKMVDIHTKEARCEFVEMDLNGQNQRLIFTLSASDYRNASVDSYMVNWVINGGKVFFYQGVYGGEGSFRYCSYPLSGGSFTYYNANGYYYDGKLFYGEGAADGKKYDLCYTELATGKKVVFKTISFSASIRFVSEGYAFILSENNFWRIAIDGSEQGKNSTFIGWADGGLTAYRGDLYYVVKKGGTDQVFKSAGLGPFHDRVQLNPESYDFAFSEGVYNGPRICGNHAFSIGLAGGTTLSERAVYAYPLDGSQQGHALFEPDVYFDYRGSAKKAVTPGQAMLAIDTAFNQRPAWRSVSVLNKELMLKCSPWAESYITRSEFVEETAWRVFGSDWTRPITRLEVCIPIVEMTNALRPFPESALKHQPDDFPFQDTYYLFVCTAWSRGITDGIGATQFNPRGELTREQMATMIYRAIKIVNTPVNANLQSTDQITLTRGDINGFSDAGQVSSWAREAMEYMVGMGLMQGVGDNRLDPKGKCKIEQCYAICYRLYDMANYTRKDF